MLRSCESERLRGSGQVPCTPPWDTTTGLVARLIVSSKAAGEACARSTVIPRAFRRNSCFLVSTFIKVSPYARRRCRASEASRCDWPVCRSPLAQYAQSPAGQYQVHQQTHQRPGRDSGGPVIRNSMAYEPHPPLSLSGPHLASPGHETVNPVKKRKARF